VGASVSVAGISSFFARRPGRPIAANIAANESVRTAWRELVDRIARENETLKQAAFVSLRLGVPQVTDREGM
jgi:hypothetical protein